MPSTNVMYIISFFIIACIIYIVFKYFLTRTIETQKQLLPKETLFDETYTKHINRNDIFPPSNNFSISWKMKVLNIPSNFVWNSSFKKNKPIIINGGCPNIYYNPSNNNLIIRFEMMDTNLNTLHKNITIKDITPQAWVKYTISVKGRNVSFYINGKLVYGYMLSSVPIKQVGTFKMGEKNNNFLGKMQDVIYYNYPLKMKEIDAS